MQESGFNHRRLGFVFFAELPGGATKIDRFHSGMLIDFGHPCLGHTHVDMFFEFSSILKFGICCFSCTPRMSDGHYLFQLFFVPLPVVQNSSRWIKKHVDYYPLENLSWRNPQNIRFRCLLRVEMGMVKPSQTCHIWWPEGTLEGKMTAMAAAFCRSCTTESSICERQGIVLGLLCYDV